MGVGPPASASRGDFLAPRRRSSPTRGGTRVPKAALGPLAMAILALLVWSSRGGSRGAPSASTARQETRSSAGVVRPSHETTRASANAGVVVRDGRRAFEPFERVRGGDRSNAEESASDDGGFAKRESTDLRVERVRQIIDDSHLPSLPPLPPDAPLPPSPDAPPERAGRDGTENRNEKRFAATKRVAGGDFVWRRPLRSSSR